MTAKRWAVFHKGGRFRAATTDTVRFAKWEVWCYVGGDDPEARAKRLAAAFEKEGVK